VEVATFRSDGTYSDGRRPDSIAFGDPQADALRRDFTINGLFFDPAAAQVIDFVGGQEDLGEGLVRAIGRADERIEEDKLRMLRAVRFAARFHFRLEKATAEAIVRHASQIGQTSGERIGQELRRMLEHETGGSAIRLLGKLRLAENLMPDCLSEHVGNPALGQLLHALPVPRFVTGLAAMLSWACEDAAQAALRTLSRRWRLSGGEQRAIAAAMSGYSTLLQADRLPWSVVQPVLAGRDAAETLELAEAWQRAFPATSGAPGISLARQRQQWPREQLDPPPLIDSVSPGSWSNQESALAVTVEGDQIVVEDRQPTE
jgi:tRNA nucleotidyltransferase (CCA-adding enzyme)